MENNTYTPEFLGKVKDAIDQIHELTKTSPYKGGLTIGTGTTFKLVVAELRKREVIQRYYEKGVVYWTWNPIAISPTKELYKNVASTLYKNARDRIQALVDKKDKRMRDAETVVKSNVASTEVKLVNFSTKELWEELKRRGCVIENGKLVERRVYS